MPKEKARPGETLIARNKRAGFDYDLGDRFEAGIVLKGSEVKMLRAGKADLTDSFCTVLRGEVFLQGVSIAAMAGAAFGHLPKGARKLLLHRREIERIDLSIAREGMTAVATRLYFKSGRAKVEIALARGKKIHDKRETIKTQDAEREMRLTARRSGTRSPAPIRAGRARRRGPSGRDSRSSAASSGTRGA